MSGDLGLHADEMGDRRQGIEIGSFEQQLASHRRPVEGTPVEGRHGATSWPPKAVISSPAELRKPDVAHPHVEADGDSQEEIDQWVFEDSHASLFAALLAGALSAAVAVPASAGAVTGRPRPTVDRTPPSQPTNLHVVCGHPDQRDAGVEPVHRQRRRHARTRCGARASPASCPRPTRTPRRRGRTCCVPDRP